MSDLPCIEPLISPPRQITTPHPPPRANHWESPIHRHGWLTQEFTRSGIVKVAPIAERERVAHRKSQLPDPPAQNTNTLGQGPQAWSLFTADIRRSLGQATSITPRIWGNSTRKRTETKTEPHEDQPAGNSVQNAEVSERRHHNSKLWFHVRSIFKTRARLMTPDSIKQHSRQGAQQVAQEYWSSNDRRDGSTRKTLSSSHMSRYELGNFRYSVTLTQIIRKATIGEVRGRLERSEGGWYSTIPDLCRRIAFDCCSEMKICSRSWFTASLIPTIFYASFSCSFFLKQSQGVAFYESARLNRTLKSLTWETECGHLKQCMGPEMDASRRRTSAVKAAFS